MQVMSTGLLEAPLQVWTPDQTLPALPGNLLEMQIIFHIPDLPKKLGAGAKSLFTKSSLQVIATHNKF